MIHSFIACVLLVAAGLGASKHREFCLGTYYSSYQLTHNSADFYATDQVSQSKWHYGVEAEIANIIPNIGIKMRGTMITYDTETGYSYEYIPLTFCTSFNMLPFLEVDWLNFTVETGLGVYWWKNLYAGEVIELPTEGRAEERDLGFIGGVSLQVRPHRNIAIEGITRYNYIASTNLTKYGYFDKDEKIWENGVGVKLMIPLW